jgi:hypothetical protein
MESNLKGWLLDGLAVLCCLYAVSVAVRALLLFI